MQVPIIKRAELFGIPVVLHQDHDEPDIWHCTEPLTGVSLSRGVTADDALAVAVENVTSHCPERLSPRGFVNIKLAGVRMKIKYAAKRSAIDSAAAARVL